MTVDELVADLEQFTTELSNVTTVTLQDLVAQLPNQIVSGLLSAGKDLNRPGSKGLRGSIRATSDGTTFGLTMNYYGYYQIFGVAGQKRSDVTPLGEAVSSAFFGKSADSIFSFSGTNPHPGIASAPRASAPIVNLADLIAETIIETIEI